MRKGRINYAHMSRYPSFVHAEQLHRTTLYSGSGGDSARLNLTYPQWQPASYVALPFVVSSPAAAVVEDDMVALGR